MRKFNRKYNELRQINVQICEDHFAEGACIINLGKTSVLCSATIDSSLPKWLKNSNSGWITAEYSMLPRATQQRNIREITSGKKSSRSSEIQRLIGRSIRSIFDLSLMPDKQIILDCDVIQADGGTRTASITGSFISVSIAVSKLLERKILKSNPIKNYICAISCGIVQGQPLLDLDYSEDSVAEVDANFVFSNNSGISEIQISGEKNTFSKKQLLELYALAEKGCNEILEIQKKILKNE